MRRLVPPLAVLALCVLAGCQRAPEASAWHREALWTVPPEIEERPFGGKYVPLFRPIVSFLGAAEVRDLSRVPAKQLLAYPKRPAGQVEAIDAAIGVRLRWRLPLAASPYLTFTPLGCTVPCTFHAAVRTPAGAITEVFQGKAAATPVFAPASVEIDLARWAGTTVDVLLEADAGVPAGTPPAQWPRATWATPAVYTRRAEAASGRDRGDAGRHPNILLVGIDTLRADAVGPRGNRPTLTPSLDRLAADSDVYPNAYTAFNITNPSFTSILTGLYGKNHGVYDLATAIAPGQTTLAQILAAQGYDTFAVISARHLGDHNTGLGRGFKTVVEAGEHLSAEMSAGAAWDWLEHAHAPFFAWVHLFDPHTPHTPPQPYASGERPAKASGADRVLAWQPFRELGPRTFAEPVLGAQSDLYDGEVAYTDRELGRLLDGLASRGLLDDTIVVVVADHGENLGEHGIHYRHVGLWETTVHVPMMIRWPGPPGRGRIRAGLVQTVDLFPTLLRAVGIAAPVHDGSDLAELVDEHRHGRRAVFAEHAGGTGAMVRTERYKYFTSKGEALIADGAYLFDLSADPDELRNLVGSGLPVERELAEVLRLWLADRRRPAGATEPQALSEEDRARLRALGYL